MNFTRTLIAAALVATSGATFAQAVIDQNRVLAGNVTPGDTPGFPLTISQPGSYKLTSNLFVPAGTDGIVITAPDVTLDLNGFSISGPVTCSQQSTTLDVTCVAPNFLGTGIITGYGSVIKNGTVKGFSNFGVRAHAGGELLERLTMTQNRTNGVNQGSRLASLRIVDSLISFNGEAGASIKDAIVSGSRFISNQGQGVAGDTRTLIVDSMARMNRNGGFVGVNANRTLSSGNLNGDAGQVQSLGVGTNLSGTSTVY